MEIQIEQTRTTKIFQRLDAKSIYHEMVDLTCWFNSEDEKSFFISLKDEMETKVKAALNAAADDVITDPLPLDTVKLFEHRMRTKYLIDEAPRRSEQISQNGAKLRLCRKKTPGPSRCEININESKILHMLGFFRIESIRERDLEEYVVRTCELSGGLMDYIQGFVIRALNEISIVSFEAEDEDEVSKKLEQQQIQRERTGSFGFDDANAKNSKKIRYQIDWVGVE